MSDDSKIKKYIVNSPKIIGYSLMNQTQINNLTSEKINEVLRQYYRLIIEGKTNGINAKNRTTLDKDGYSAANEIRKRTSYNIIDICYVLLALVWCVKDGVIPNQSINPGKETAKKMIEESQKTWIQKALENIQPEISKILGNIGIPVVIVGGILIYMFVKPYLKN